MGASAGSHQPVVVGWGATHSYGPAERPTRTSTSTSGTTRCVLARELPTPAMGTLVDLCWQITGATGGAWWELPASEWSVGGQTSPACTLGWTVTWTSSDNTSDL